MRARDIARANLVLNKIHAAVVDGLMDEKEIFEDSCFISLLFLVYEDKKQFPKGFAVVIHDIRKVLLERRIIVNEITENLQPILDEIRKRQRHKQQQKKLEFEMNF